MNTRMRLVLGIVVVVAVAAVGFQVSQRQAVEGGGEPATELAPARVPLFDDLGSFHRSISTSVATAQDYFDQGLRLTYAFNHAEAIRAFEEATRLDPSCAMCYWGIAYAYGPNINLPMDAESGVAAYAAIQTAQSLVASASAVERALIEALAVRYAPDPPEDRAALDRAYADAMRGVRRQFSGDLDVLTLHAEAVMNLSPWDYWTRDGQPRAGTAELIADLEGVLAVDPNHPGACHYYIHAVEAVQPERAVACAERLASLMPGAGHLVHMPAHIYIRVGRWADAITANEHAVHADETYIADVGPTGVYPLAYYPHNYHFLSFAATMAGRSAQAVRAAVAVVENVPADIAAVVPELQPLLAYKHLTLVTFGRWDDVLAEPVPSSELGFTTALVNYARGVAFAAKQDAAQARSALDAVRAAMNATDDELGRAVLDIAQHALAGEIAFRGGDARAAEAHFRAAMQIEDGLLYMEPPHWYYPIRHSLGAVLLEAGRAADAERVYREDLARFPENAWSLTGLAASLRAQGRADEAGEVEQRRAQLGGDVQLTASRF
jgi:tetratricopeptide (TPR) repeat protein